MSAELRETARAIFAAAMRAVDVRAAVRRNIAASETVLTLAGRTVPLVEVDRVLILAIGKAAVPMYQAAAEALATVPSAGVVVAPTETLPPAESTQERVLFLPGAHPVPTGDSVHAAEAALQLLARATEHSVVLFLISGGASAMLEKPLDPAILLEGIASFHRALVGSGMNITEINTLRKHFSAVKGGRLARAAASAYLQCTLLISDVPAASPDAIASGPSLPDSTTIADTRHLFARLQQAGPVPPGIAKWFRSPELPETPKRDDQAFARAHWKTVLSSEHLEEAAAHAAEAIGFHALVDNVCDDWEYRNAARHLLDRGGQFADQHNRTCLISVGEVTVNLPVNAGEGGRNQQFALWCATELKRRGMHATVLSAGSDGVDGHSSAAGAICDETTSVRATALGLSPTAALAKFDSAPLLRAIDDALQTGPTGNNLRDLRLVLIEK